MNGMHLNCIDLGQKKMLKAKEWKGICSVTVHILTCYVLTKMSQKLSYLYSSRKSCFCTLPIVLRGSSSTK